MLIFVLYRPKIAANIGSVARVMKNFGEKHLFIVSPKCDPHSDEAKCLAKGAQDVLKKARIVKSVSEINADLLVATSAKTAGPRNVLRNYQTPKELAKNLGKGRVAILFGPEDSGLSNEIIEKCDHLLRIPTTKEYRALNLAVSAAIILYELKSAGFDTKEIAKREEFATVQKFLKKVARPVYEKGEERKMRTALLVLKRVLSRAVLERKEAQTLYGFLKRVENCVTSSLP